jgi:translation machinery-associated protein 16
VAYFQVNIKENGGEPIDVATVQELIEGCVFWQTELCGWLLTCLRYIAFAEEEYSEAKKERRPGRPASAKEDLMKLRLDTLQHEHQQGFCKLFFLLWTALFWSWTSTDNCSSPSGGHNT